MNDFVLSTEPHFVQTTEAAIGKGVRAPLPSYPPRPASQPVSAPLRRPCLERRFPLDCPHEQHVRDPSDRAERKPSLVCLACGVLGTTCDVCERFYPEAPLGYIPEEWCRKCDCCPSCCVTPDSSLTPGDVARAIDLSVRRVTDDYIRERIRSAPTRDDAITAARKELSLGGMCSLGFSLSGFRDRVNKGRGLTVQFGHRSGVVTWAQVADYVLAGDAAVSTIAAQQLSLFG